MIAGVSILVSLLWLLPFAAGFYSWPLDLVLSAAWFAAFGLLVDQLSGQNCGRTFNWSGITRGGFCNRWKAAQAFSFLSGIYWLASAILGIWFMSRARRDRAVVTENVKSVYRAPSCFPSWEANQCNLLQQPPSSLVPCSCLREDSDHDLAETFCCERRSKERCFLLFLGQPNQKTRLRGTLGQLNELQFGRLSVKLSGAAGLSDLNN